MKRLLFSVLAAGALAAAQPVSSAELPTTKLTMALTSRRVMRVNQ